jgi:hypothetical protein
VQQKVVVVVEMMVQIALTILEDLVVLVVVPEIKTRQVLPVLVFLVKEILVVLRLEALILIKEEEVVVPEVPVLMEVLDHTVE